MNKFYSLRRSIGRRFPKLREIWSLARGPGIHFIWLLRNIFTANRPIEVRIGNKSVYMVPEGHIAELMWSDWFEKEERNFVENNLKPGMRVLNIGANVGLYTLIAAKIVDSNGEVHAFEPSSLNFSRLKRNVALNGLCNVHLSQMAVSDFTGTLAVMCDPAHPNLDSHYFVRRVEDGNTPANAIEFIHCDTIDNYWSNLCRGDVKMVDMIIIDVEGAELSVFKGGQALFAASPNLVIMAECTENLDETEMLLRAQGFSLCMWNAEASCYEETPMRRGTIYAVRKH